MVAHRHWQSSQLTMTLLWAHTHVCSGVVFVSFKTSLIKVTLLNISNAELPVSFCIFLELTHKHICINDLAWHVASAEKYEPRGRRGSTVRGHFHARLGQRFDLIGSRATWLVCRICLICMLTWRGCGLLSELSQHLCWCMELQAAQGRWLILCIYICFLQSTADKLLQSTWAVDTSRRKDLEYYCMKT